MNYEMSWDVVAICWNEIPCLAAGTWDPHSSRRERRQRRLEIREQLELQRQQHVTATIVTQAPLPRPLLPPPQPLIDGTCSEDAFDFIERVPPAAFAAAGASRVPPVDVAGPSRRFEAAQASRASLAAPLATGDLPGCPADIMPRNVECSSLRSTEAMVDGGANGLERAQRGILLDAHTEVAPRRYLRLSRTASRLSQPLHGPTMSPLAPLTTHDLSFPWQLHDPPRPRQVLQPKLVRVWPVSPPAALSTRASATVRARSSLPTLMLLPPTRELALPCVMAASDASDSIPEDLLDAGVHDDAIDLAGQLNRVPNIRRTGESSVAEVCQAPALPRLTRRELLQDPASTAVGTAMSTPQAGSRHFSRVEPRSSEGGAIAPSATAQSPTLLDATMIVDGTTRAEIAVPAGGSTEFVDDMIPGRSLAAVEESRPLRLCDGSGIDDLAGAGFVCGGTGVGHTSVAAAVPSPALPLPETLAQSSDVETEDELDGVLTALGGVTGGWIHESSAITPRGLPRRPVAAALLLHPASAFPTPGAIVHRGTTLKPASSPSIALPLQRSSSLRSALSGTPLMQAGLVKHPSSRL